MKKTKQPLGDSKQASDKDSRGRKLTRQLTGELLREVFPRLKGMAVATIKVEYSGYANTRAINFVEYFNAENHPVDVSANWPACSPIIEHVVHELLPENFEAGQGGQGDVKIDLEAQTLTIEHEENYVAVRESIRRYTL
jgi:hypothetical protein